MARCALCKKQIPEKKCVLLGMAFFCCPGPTPASAGDANYTTPKFLGAQTCSSSSCHGGAGNKQNQFTIWAKDDFHHERPYALLETRRSATIADFFKISNPERSTRCTVCHAPFHTVPPEQLAPQAKIIEGVSCESCHAPAENWLRSHTRQDWTTADRVQAGMRDLKIFMCAPTPASPAIKMLMPIFSKPDTLSLFLNLMVRAWPVSNTGARRQIGTARRRGSSGRPSRCGK